ncbi:uncharacterized protein LOC119382243 [Rhipicephalus sanguineus]|uniref:uncharacterized protein LOC119382243 n=1 Tax=Rhipicephalus sanguineus TaxID=34632 RepID=UPI0020C42492|nr:uncharacterized protein LOC119382243 [Rhipicephalus sanguineus]
MRATGGGVLGGLKGRVLALVGPACAQGLGDPPYFSDSDDDQQPDAPVAAQAQATQPGASGLPSRQPCPPAPRQGTFTGRRGFGPRRTAGFGRARTSSPQASQEDLLAQAIDHGRQSVLASQQLCKAQREQVEATRKQTAVLEKGLKSVADAVKELCEIGRRQEERLRRLEENLSPLATLATSTVVVLPQQPMPGQQPPQPPQ